MRWYKKYIEVASTTLGSPSIFEGVAQFVADESHELALSAADVYLHHEDTVCCGLRYCRDTGLHDVAAALTLFDIDDAIAGVDRVNQAAKRLRSLGGTLDQRGDAGVMRPDPRHRRRVDTRRDCGVSSTCQRRHQRPHH